MHPNPTSRGIPIAALPEDRYRLGVRIVVARCDPDNVASIGTLERTGFRRTGEENGQLRWRYDGKSVDA